MPAAIMTQNESPFPAPAVVLVCLLIFRGPKAFRFLAFPADIRKRLDSNYTQRRQGRRPDLGPPSLACQPAASCPVAAHLLWCSPQPSELIDGLC